MGAVIFDCDGVVVDSEPASVRAWSRAIERAGRSATAEEIAVFVGHTDQAIAEHFGRLVGVAPAELEEAANQELRALIGARGIRPFPDTVALLDTLAATGVPVAVASNSRRWRLDLMLSGAGVGERFAVSVAADEVVLPKPAPDVYLKAAGLLALDADLTLVVEDTPTGVAAGKAAGFRVVAIDRGVFGDGLAGADVVVPDLAAGLGGW